MYNNDIITLTLGAIRAPTGNHSQMDKISKNYTMPKPHVGQARHTPTIFKGGRSAFSSLISSSDAKVNLMVGRRGRERRWGEERGRRRICGDS